MNKYPLFFLHIPRTGGTTVDEILTKKFPTDNTLKIYKKNEYKENRFRNSEEIEKIQYITGHLLLGKSDPPSIYDHPVRAFTFLREPVSRLISEYIFYKTWPNQHLFNYIREKNLTFKDYILSSEDILKYRGKNFMTRCISGQGFEYRKKPLSALAFAKRQLEKNFFFFGITEYFNESILLLFKKLNFENPLHEQRNKLKSTLKNEISDDDKELAKELNQADIELYKFAKNLFKSKISELGEEFHNDLSKFIFLNTKYQSIANIINNSELSTPDDQIILPKNN